MRFDGMRWRVWDVDVEGGERAGICYGSRCYDAKFVNSCGKNLSSVMNP